MNERDFDRIISKKLKNDDNQYPDLDKNWEKVVEKMKSSQNTGPSSVAVLPNHNNATYKPIIPWLLAAILLLLGSNSWLFWRFLQPNHASNIVQVAENKEPTKKTLRLYDTIVETKVIYKFDTIYKTIVQEVRLLKEYNNNNSEYSDALASKLPPSVKLTSAGVNQSNVVSESRKFNIIDNNSTINTSKIVDNKKNMEAAITSTSRDTQSVNVLQKLENSLKTDSPIVQKIGLDMSNSAQSDTNININTDSLSRTLYSKKVTQPHFDSLNVALTPVDSLEMKHQNAALDIIIKPSRNKKIIDHYSIGLQAGTSFELPKSKDIDNGSWRGVMGEVAFNQNFTLGVAADFESFHFKTQTRNPILLLPQDPPMTDRYNLKYIEGLTKSWLSSVSISYFLRPKAKVNPFVFVGFGHRWVVPDSVEYEFVDKVTHEEKSFMALTSLHQDNFLSIGGGVECVLLPKLFGRLRGEYVYDPNNGGHNFNYVVLRGGLFYRF